LQGPRPFLIGGQWRQGNTAAPVHDPFTGKVVAEVCQASDADADAAVQSTVEAAKPMGALPAHRRYHLLQRIAGSLYDRREEFARLMTGEAG
jgi:acyl-CoA reductase-like NAD-dependent aldehyde dehydrogenase